MTNQIPFDIANPDIEAARQIFLAWLANGGGNQIPYDGTTFDPYVEYVGHRDPRILAFSTIEVFWQLLIEGVVAPGMNASNLNLPWFHVTAHGRKILDSSEPAPHDPTGYLNRLHETIKSPDATVIAYLAESLQVYRRGNHVASTILLGIAAERVFLLLCDSLVASLRNSREKVEFQKLLDKFPMKPKLTWVHTKIQNLQTPRKEGFPENALIALTTIYDLLRTQRNDLGHPRDIPPVVKREDAFVNLQVFPRFYQVAEELRAFLSANQV